ncbi:type II secretion system protein GspJ [Endozoicomonas sp. OPT23]|uniref:type II secretion system minor pseudopilin GspJ n=1 Tax=Endozoicomonas sp. OPT23 TaxID=2072845 RepID=UPI00129B62BC|nr:type II secretion system minor pseudopilin GspJ [Endozoicomonas sp. OPT23]MRI32232.1 type II secretion system protein GspJ [Endozoicomonas sp. OPT23]
MSVSGRMAVKRAKPFSDGFTLLEMLLALVIFTLVSLSSWQVLNTVTSARDVQADKLKRLEALDYTFLILKQDIRQIVERGVRIDGKVSQRAIFSGEILDSEDQGLTFVRAGWQNAQSRLPRSTLQRVYYRLNEGKLQRGYDRVLDQSLEADPVYRNLLTGVNELKFRFYYKEGRGRSGSWQDIMKEQGWPSAIAVNMVLDKEGEIERRFMIPGSFEVQHGS